MKVGVLTFPGSNCDHDIVNVLNEHFQAHAELLWHADLVSERYDLMVVPGGFSYGDYLRSGAIARFAPAMNSLRDHVKSGRPVLGICNGFQILCEAGFLPGALIRNINLKHVCRDVHLKSLADNHFTGALAADRKYRIPVSHSDGNYRIDEDGLKALRDNHQIAFVYAGDNPNGSVEDIAGVSDREGRVLGMMPHPERAVDPLIGGVDGRPILQAVLARVA